MKAYYDLHIHSALSPCGDNDMTPNNIVNMSMIKGLDVIALTDHNSCANVRAAMAAAEGKLLVIPGMEIETSEEVHVVALFPDADAAEEMERILKASAPQIKNRPEIFGNQYIMDKNDEIVGEEERMLVTASGMDIFSVVDSVSKLGGAAYPAHIDRSSYSILSNLGFIPPELKIGTVEITEKSRNKMEVDYNKLYNIVTSSDAHYLWDIAEKGRYLELDELSAAGIIERLK